MSKPELRPILLVSLLTAGCGGGGLQYWLYPEPHLPVEDEAVFATYESNRLLYVDGEDTATLCWGEQRMAAQGYRRTDRLCRLHITPGKHTVIFQTGLYNRQRATLEFEALPGRVYGLQRSGCTASVDGTQQNCRFEIMEIGSFREGG